MTTTKRKKRKEKQAKSLYTKWYPPENKISRTNAPPRYTPEQFAAMATWREDCWVDVTDVVSLVGRDDEDTKEILTAIIDQDESNYSGLDDLGADYIDNMVPYGWMLSYSDAGGNEPSKPKHKLISFKEDAVCYKLSIPPHLIERWILHLTAIHIDKHMAAGTLSATELSACGDILSASITLSNLYLRQPDYGEKETFEDAGVLAEHTCKMLFKKVRLPFIPAKWYDNRLKQEYAASK